MDHLDLHHVTTLAVSRNMGFLSHGVDGRTALKASVSRFGDRTNIGLVDTLNPANANIGMSRSWFDGGNPFGIPGLPSCIPSAADPTGSACIAGDGIVQGDPLNNLPNGEIASPNTTPAFATPAITNSFGPEWAFGWEKMLSNWEFSGSIQRAEPRRLRGRGVLPARLRNFETVDDRLEQCGGLGHLSVRGAQELFPDGRGYTLTLVDLNPAAVARERCGLVS